MTAVKNFRVDSFVIGLAIKAPVHVATNLPITLSGEQTVNGRALLVGQRCLVKDQVDPIENGIYVVETSAWQRTGDFDGSRDVVAGTVVPAYRVSDGEFVYWMVDGVGAETKFPGVDAITFSAFLDPAAAAAASLQAVTAVGNTTDIGIDITDGAALRIFHTGGVENVTIDVDDVITAPDRALAFTTTANIFVYNFDKDINVDGGQIYLGSGGDVLFYRIGDAVSSSIGSVGANIVITAVGAPVDIIADSVDMNESPFIDYTVQHQTVSSAAGALLLPYRSGQSIQLTLTENITSTTFDNLPNTGKLAELEIELTQDGTTAYTVNWGTFVRWPGGVAPDLSTLGSVHLIHFRTRDGGSNIYGTFASDFS